MNDSSTAAAGLALCVVLAACCTDDPRCAAPSRLAAPASTAPAAPASCGAAMQIPLPSGVSVARLDMLDQGQQFTVYTSFEMSKGRVMTEAPLPDADSLERELIDVMKRSRRFHVIKLPPGGVADRSDVTVTARILDVQQKLVPLEGGMRVSASSVRLSVQVENIDGEMLLTSDGQVEGHTGATNGDRVAIPKGASLSSPEIQRALAEDIRTAAFRAFEKADERIESLLRPMARVIGAPHGCTVDLFSGSSSGLQPGDRLVVFRAGKSTLGNTPILVGVQTVALLDCGSVGESQSQCTLAGVTQGYAAKEGDYAVVTDESMKHIRQR
jgi:hypothetical protein